MFAFLTDAANHPRWDPTSVEMEALTPGPWREGTELQEVRRVGPRRIDLRSRVAELELDRRFRIETLTPPSFEGLWEFEAVPGGTVLHHTATLALDDVPRLVRPLVRRSFGPQLDAAYARLERVVNGGAGR